MFFSNRLQPSSLENIRFILQPLFLAHAGINWQGALWCCTWNRYWTQPLCFIELANYMQCPFSELWIENFYVHIMYRIILCLAWVFFFVYYWEFLLLAMRCILWIYYLIRCYDNFKKGKRIDDICGKYEFWTDLFLLRWYSKFIRICSEACQYFHLKTHLSVVSPDIGQVFLEGDKRFPEKLLYFIGWELLCSLYSPPRYLIMICFLVYNAAVFFLCLLLLTIWWKALLRVILIHYWFGDIWKSFFAISN